MTMNNRWRRLGAMVVLAAWSACAEAAIVPYADDRAGFIADTGAASIGDFPGDKLAVSSRVVGIATFATDSGSLFFGDFSSRVPGNEMIISGQEDFHVDLSTKVFAFGLDIFEPAFGGASGCNTAACVDTTFRISIYDGNNLIESFDYNAPDDLGGSSPVALGFFGVHSSVAFNRIVVNDVTGNSDNEFFANVVVGRTALQPPSSVPEPATAALVGVALAGLLCARRRPIS